MSMSSAFVDGNELAGPLGEVFAVDMTAALGVCAGCGTRGPIGAARVYSNAPGLVARCPQCEEVLMKVVRAENRVWLDLRGLSAVEIRL
jgi:hypothetical protein